MSASATGVVLIRCSGVILSAMRSIICAGVPISVVLTAIRSGGALVSVIAVLHSIAVPTGRNYNAGGSCLNTCSAVDKQLAARAFVVGSVARLSTGSRFCSNRGQMICVNMTGCCCNHIAALRTCLRLCFCGSSAVRVVRINCVVMVRIACAGIRMTVSTLVAPCRSVKIMCICIKGSVGDSAKNFSCRALHFITFAADHILVPAPVCAI